MTTTGTAQLREADLLLGRKCVWEFDPLTRGWKIVVDADLNIEDIQIGAVEIKDHTTDDRAHVDASGLLHVFDHAVTGAFILVWVTYDYPEDSPHTSGDYLAFVGGVRQHGIASPVDVEGDYQGFIFNNLGQLHTYTTGSHVIADTELPVAVALSDGLANPTAPAVGSHLLAWDNGLGLWRRVTTAGGTCPIDVTESNPIAFAFNADGCLTTAICTGTVVADTELPVAAVLSDVFANPTAPAVGAFAMGYYPTSGTWSRLTVDENDFLEVTLGTRLDETTDEVTAYVTGTVTAWITGTVVADTELPAAVALTDTLANPTTPIVGAALLAWDEVASLYERARSIDINGTQETGDVSPTLAVGAILRAEYMSGITPYQTNLRMRQTPDWGLRELLVHHSGTHTTIVTGSAVQLIDADGDMALIDAAGNLMVNMGVRLDELTDEVTAYVTGTVGIDFMPALGIGISGTVTVDTELPAAAALADATATPTAPAVGSFGHAWDEVDDTWDRMRQEGGSGSYALRTSSWVAGQAGYEELINKSVAAWSDRDLIVFHSGTHVTMVTGSAMNILGQTRTIERSIINITGSAGEYMLVTGVAGRQVKVTEVMAIATADTELIFESGWTGTWLTGKLSMPADGDKFFCGACATPDQHHFETESGDILVLNLVAGAQVGGWINWYYE